MKILKDHSRLVLAFALTAAVVLPIAVQAQEMYLSLADPVAGKASVPGTCTVWHELWPVHCQFWHQVNYVDQPDDPGTGEISVCDYIEIVDPVTGAAYWFHVEWVGPTYTVSEVPYEPVGDPSEPVVCQYWQEIPRDPIPPEEWPDPVHVEDWNDADMDGEVSPCDDVMLNGVWYHIDDVTVNITVVPGDPVATEEKTWGETKTLYEDEK